jgi:cytochrome c biogenesis protein
MLARDLQSIVLYDQEGKFVGVRRPSSKLPIDIDGTKIVIVDAIGSSGLDLKVMTQKITLVLNNMGFSLTA